jgi:putative transposase
VRDAVLRVLLVATWRANYSVYGARKLWKELRRQGEDVGRDQVARLMRALGIAGATRRRRVRTTRPDATASRAPDLVNRRFQADRPNALWVADFTYVATWAGVVYVAFVVDVCSRRIVGWRAATSMRAQLVLDALNMAAWSRRAMRLDGLICHSDAGSQYTSIVYTERLAEIGAAPSIGSVGDSFDNALAESVIGLYKAELIYNPTQGPWRTFDNVELATATYIQWFNELRLHGELGDVPPAEFETAFADGEGTEAA